MKKITLFLTAILFSITGILAQTPNQFKYQAVLRNADGTIMAEESVTVDISILESDLVTSVFDETHTVTTTAQGLINLNIGSVSDLSVIDFSTNTYFIEISINSIILGTSQLLSVPYAMTAKTAENVFSGNYNDLTNQPTLFDGTFGSLTGTPTTITGYGITDAFDSNWSSLIGTTPNISIFNNDAGYLTSITAETDPIFIAWDKNYFDLTNRPVNATTSTDGFMSSTDKTKLDNLANVNITAGTGISISGTYPNKIIASSHTHYLGETYLDGIIFNLYIDSDGQQHGLIVSITETEDSWQNTGVLVNADRTEDGLYNTGLMTDSPARDWVESLGTGWYLPSVDELSLLWHNRYYVNKSLRMNGQTLLSTTATYWSSNETNVTYAYNFFFTNGSVTSNGAKPYKYRVRGVKAF